MVQSSCLKFCTFVQFMKINGNRSKLFSHNDDLVPNKTSYLKKKARYESGVNAILYTFQKFFQIKQTWFSSHGPLILNYLAVLHWTNEEMWLHSFKRYYLVLLFFFFCSFERNGLLPLLREFINSNLNQVQVIVWHCLGERFCFVLVLSVS